MRHEPISRGRTLGADLRALRRARGLTLQTAAAHLGRSVGWLSQVERDLSTPDTDDLDRIAALLDVAVPSLSQRRGKAEEAGHVVRAVARRPIGSRTAGLDEELLSPDLTDAFEVVRSVFAPGAELEEATVRSTQEVGYIVAGALDLWIEGHWFALAEGDSFRIRGERFRWRNRGKTPCVAIWVIAPPVY